MVGSLVGHDLRGGDYYCGLECYIHDGGFPVLGCVLLEDIICFLNCVVRREHGSVVAPFPSQAEIPRPFRTTTISKPLRVSVPFASRG